MRLNTLLQPRARLAPPTRPRAARPTPTRPLPPNAAAPPATSLPASWGDDDDRPLTPQQKSAAEAEAAAAAAAVTADAGPRLLAWLAEAAGPDGELGEREVLCMLCENEEGTSKQATPLNPPTQPRPLSSLSSTSPPPAAA